MLVLFISWPMNSATVILMTTVITIIIFQRLPKGTHFYFFFKLNHRWPCSTFDHGQSCVTFQYKDLYNTGKKITSSGCECERIYIVFYFYFFTFFFFVFWRVFLLLSSYQLIFNFVHNYFHLVIFHRLFDHLVQWITLDITKRRYSEHILPVPWPFVIWRFHCHDPFYEFLNAD